MSETKFYWRHNPDTGESIYVTGEEFIKELRDLVVLPVQSMQENDGDMFMSDYQKLISASWHIVNAISQIGKNNAD